MFSSVYFWLYRWKRGLPHPDELNKMERYDLERRVGHRRYVMARLYAEHYTIEYIADLFNVTTERVRQCVYKVYREDKKYGN